MPAVIDIGDCLVTCLQCCPVFMTLRKSRRSVLKVQFIAIPIPLSIEHPTYSYKLGEDRCDKARVCILPGHQKHSSSIWSRAPQPLGCGPQYRADFLSRCCISPSLPQLCCSACHTLTSNTSSLLRAHQPTQVEQKARAILKAANCRSLHRLRAALHCQTSSLHTPRRWSCAQWDWSMHSG